VTDVIDVSLGGSALSASENKGLPFPTLAVGNAEMDSANWVPGRHLSPDEEAEPTPGNSGRARCQGGSTTALREV
jgi:hypothetical protein